MKRCIGILIIGGILVSLITPGFAAPRIKDIAYVEGVRENQLLGYGLVVGLNRTGDRQTSFPTLQTVGNMLRRLGIYISPNEVESKLKTRNIAAVMVTAKLPPLARPGTKIDVVVSSIGDATSLEGGVLLQAPLQAADGKVYAVAQGSLSTGLGVTGNTRGGASLTVARVPEGAYVEREVPATIVTENAISIILKEPDFTTASRVIENINEQLGGLRATASDAGYVRVKIPEEYQDNIVGFVSLIENVPIIPDARAKVVINERTGTIVAGKDVKIATVGVSHGNINVQVTNQRQYSETSAGSSEDTLTKVIEQSVNESSSANGTGMKNMEVIEESVSVNDLVQSLNALGVAPKDLIAILQAIKEAGALHAELEVL
ncbi:MAG: flagellar basal body P-ring protein FlgI [Candidatus Omnitrophica bacterium]|nr:flagellar basal body P-ring protein FlgI [Candidatus Omnitrophota bacterium]